MRILFFLHNISKTRHFDTVLEMLAERDHAVILAAERTRKPLALLKHASLVNRRLAERGKRGRIELIGCPVRRVDRWARLAPALRRARDYMRVLDARYDHADKLRDRAAENAPAGWPAFIDARPWLRRRWRTVARALALAEDVIPSEKLYELFIAYERPDLVLVTPLVDYGSYQTDYVKAAHRLGVPVGFLPFSWDNLTNRGLIRVQPDRLLVWNEMQKREAVELHGTPPDRVVVTGAPRFDEFFSMRPAAGREAFCRRVHLDPATPFVLYVCSSEFVAPREVDFVRQWIAALRQSADPLVRGAGILVRPHPVHLKQWSNADLSSCPQVALWSEKETMNADQGLYDSLFHSRAVVGLNTSAMIEAGILGKPVHTIVTSEFAGGQEQTIHFGYLRAANGGLLHEAASLEEHAGQLAAALRRDGGSDQERRFVERFVRPRGLDVPVAPIMVEEIERMARIRKRSRRHAAWWPYPVRWSVQAAMAMRRF